MIIQQDLSQLLFGPTSPHGAESGSRGKPVGARYALGNGWLPYLRQSQPECDRHSAKNDCAMGADVAAKHYWVGPPHVMHVAELAQLVPHWYNDTLRRREEILAKAAASVGHPIRSPRGTKSNALSAPSAPRR